MKLKGKQARFVEEYLKDLNGAQAAIRAGYSHKTAKAMAFENLEKPHISSAIVEAQKKRSEQTGITNERVLLEIARIAFNDPRRVFSLNGSLLPVQDWPDDVSASISSVKVVEIKGPDGSVFGETKEVKFWDKGKHLELAGRHLGIFEKDNNQKKEAMAALAASAAISAADAYKIMIGK